MRIIAKCVLFVIVLLIFSPPPPAASSEHCFHEYEAEHCDNGNLIDGYWWYGSWTPGLPTYGSQFMELPLTFTGKAVFYAPGVMEATADYRRLSLDNYLGGVAMPTCASIGRPVWIMRETTMQWEGPYLVVDCPRRNDLYGVAVIREEAVEVDFDTAVRWGMIHVRPNYTWSAVRWMEYVKVSQVAPRCIYGQPEHLHEWILPRIEYSTHDYRFYTLYTPPNTWRIGGELYVFRLQYWCEPVMNYE